MLGNLNDPGITTATILVMVAVTLALLLTIFGEERKRFHQPNGVAMTASLVFVMVAITVAFFLIADQIMRLVVTFFLAISG
jgi:multisubunit Na+/H+ antiporter MnhB subunit